MASSPVDPLLEAYAAGRAKATEVVAAVAAACYGDAGRRTRDRLRPLLDVIERAAPGVVELARLHVEEPPPPLRKKRPELSKRFERVVLKCLAKHPDDRYRDAADLLADLADFEMRSRATLDVGVPPVGTKEKRPWPLLAAIGAALVLLVALVVTLMR